MALISTLTDNFNDNSLSASWTSFVNSPYTVNEQNQQIEIYMSGSSGYHQAGIISTSTYDLTSSGFSVKLVDAGNMALINYQIEITAVDTSTGGEEVSWRIVYGNIRAVKLDGGVETTLATDTYNASTHLYLRIRESSGTTYWDYSADGINWTNFHSVANTLNDITVIKPKLYVWGGSNAEATTVILDDFNILPISETIKKIMSIDYNNIKKISSINIENINRINGV